MGNYSRNTFNKLKHYVGVRLQQGVPLVDADWNEKEDIWKHQLRNVVKNIVGDGVPKDNDGFKIIPVAGENNNFAVKGGTTSDPGIIFVDGWEVLNESDLNYNSQTLLTDSTKAAEWNVPALTALSAPSSGERTDSVYLDVWEWEVDSTDDSDLVNPAIDIETCLRLKREWVVRVAVNATDLPDAPDGHSYCKLAEITRRAGQDAILEADIADKRRTGLGIPDYDFLDTVMVRNGKVGIDTDTPEVKLDVRGDTSIGDRHMNYPEAFLTDNTTASDLFGCSVDIDGDQAIVGAYSKDITVGGTKFANAGAAYILKKNSEGEWEKVQELHAGTIQADAFFGFAVSISGDKAVVGAYGENLDAGTENSGSAYIFEKNSSGVWARESTLEPDTAAANDEFGYSVHIDGTRAIVGAWKKNVEVNSETKNMGGAAYIFERSSEGAWTRADVLIADDTGSMDRFGTSVHIDDEQAIIGAMFAGAGAAYIFTKDTGSTYNWSQTAKLAETTGAEIGDRFGMSVAISGDRAVVGAHCDNAGANHSGAVFVFEKDANGTWAKTAKLVPDNPREDDTLGMAVAINGTQVIAGAGRFAEKEPKSNAVYVFQIENNTWSQVQVLTSDAGPNKDAYGRALASNGNDLIVGAFGDGTGGSYAGAVYIYKKDSSGLWQSSRKYDGGDLEVQGTLHFNKNRRALIDVPGTGHEIGIHPDAQYFRTQDNFAFYKGDTMQMVLKDGGLGIGTDVPAEKLDVRGSGTIGDETENVAHILKTANEEDSSYLGSSVSVEGDWLIAGSKGVPNATNIGAAILYKKDTRGNWVETQKLVSDNQSLASSFGRSVAMAGNQVLIGAINDNCDTVSDCGAVYVFEKSTGSDTWTQVQKIKGDDTVSGDTFGYSISVSGNTSVISALNHDGNGNNSGAAYIFEKGTDNRWTQTHKIVPSQATIIYGSTYGKSLCIDGGRIIVGSPDDDVTQGNSGAVYIYEKVTDDDNNVTWPETIRIKSTSPVYGVLLGFSVAIEGTVAAAGELFRSENGVNCGAVYIYEKDGSDWVERKKLLPTIQYSSARFGNTVTIKDGRILVGMQTVLSHELKVAMIHMYKKNEDEWQLAQVIRSEGRSAYDDFGQAMSVSGSTLAVGAHCYNDKKGAVHVFEKDNQGLWQVPGRYNGNLALQGTLSFSEKREKLIDVPGTNYEIGAHKDTQYFRSDDHFAWYRNNEMAMTLREGRLAIGTYDPGGDHLDVRGRGHFSAGTSTTNADYAEYFESSNGKAIPAGTAVSLTQTGKIRPAKDGETPIGIISVNPSLVGNSPKEWPGKYMCDDLGYPLEEEVEKEITNEDGTVEKTIEKQPVLNPDFDPEKKYTPRSSGDRPEWNCVGLLGQLPMLKGQPTAPTWIKIKTISKKAELWLVK